MWLFLSPATDSMNLCMRCESDKSYGCSPLFGYNYSVLLAGDISVGDIVYTNTLYIIYQIMHCVDVPFGKYMCVLKCTVDQ